MTRRNKPDYAGPWAEYVAARRDYRNAMVGTRTEQALYDHCCDLELRLMVANKRASSTELQHAAELEEA